MSESDDAEPGVIREDVVLPDGRLLFFYTFVDGDDEADER